MASTRPLTYSQAHGWQEPVIGLCLQIDLTFLYQVYRHCNASTLMQVLRSCSSCTLVLDNLDWETLEGANTYKWQLDLVIRQRSRIHVVKGVLPWLTLKKERDFNRRYSLLGFTNSFIFIKIIKSNVPLMFCYYNNNITFKIMIKNGL